MPPSRRLLILAAAAAAAFSLLAAGCGGSGGHPPGIASVASTTATTTSTAQTGAVAFAQCMRSHGIPNWPDPVSGGGFDKAKLQQLGVPGPRIRAVEDGPCNHLLPESGGTPAQTQQQQATQLADALSFAHCMRSHGVSGFPDPTAQGQLSVEMVQAAGIDVHSTAVLQVVQRCLPASHGGLTAAKVREALANAGANRTAAP